MSRSEQSRPATVVANVRLVSRRRLEICKTNQSVPFTTLRIDALLKHAGSPLCGMKLLLTIGNIFSLLLTVGSAALEITISLTDGEIYKVYQN